MRHVWLVVPLFLAMSATAGTLPWQTPLKVTSLAGSEAEGHLMCSETFTKHLGDLFFKCSNDQGELSLVHHNAYCGCRLLSGQIVCEADATVYCRAR